MYGKQDAAASSASPETRVAPDARIVDIKRREKQIEEEKSMLISELENAIIGDIRHLRQLVGVRAVEKCVAEALDKPC